MSQTSPKHDATVVAVGRDRLTVSLKRSGACAACHAAANCLAAEGREMLVDVPVADAAAYSVGEQVSVQLAPHAATRAIVTAFLLPLVAMTLVLAIVVKVTGSELAGALSALAALVASWLLTRLLHRRVEKQLQFRINKQ